MARPLMALKSYIHSTFDPRRIPGLESWWDAGDAASVTLDAGRVSQLSDKSGKGRHAANTTSGSTQPTYALGARNGLNVARFAAASVQRLTVESSTAAYNFLHDGTDSYFAAVSVYGTSSNPDLGLGLFGNNGASTANIGSIYFFDDRFSASRNNAIGFLTSKGVVGQPPTNFLQLNIVTPQTMIVQDAVIDANNATGLDRFRLRLDGGAEITQSTVTNAPTALNATNSMQLGAVGANVFALEGDICELLMFSQVPTAAARDLIRRYLGAKWGVTVA
jgi:hypothetical protein